jgi:hypothetical protein
MLWQINNNIVRRLCKLHEYKSQLEEIAKDIEEMGASL